MDSELEKIVFKSSMPRSLRCEILKGKKRLPPKYVVKFLNNPRIELKYSRYLLDWELKKLDTSVQMSLEDFLDE